MTRKTTHLLFASGLFGSLPLWGENEGHGSLPGETKAQYDQRVQWFRDAKFGMFVTWGPVTLTGREIGWSRGGERRSHRGTGQTPVEIYDNLYQHFNPSLFDAEEWMQIAREAGMKYLVFVTKHHDGFALWDTKLSDYRITGPESLYGEDICKQLADACHKYGLHLGWYCSLPDWYHPYFLTEQHERFLEFMHGQVRELVNGLGREYPQGEYDLCPFAQLVW